MTDEKRKRIFLAKGVAKMYGCKAAEKKQIGEIFQKLNAVRHVTGNDQDYLREIPRVVVQKSALL